MKNILYEDDDILVAYKPAGIATQTSRIGQQDMVSELKNYLVKAQKEEMAGKNGKDAVKKQTFQEPYLGLVHRLDQPVSGVLVFAKNKKTAADLSNQVTNGTMKKFYYALIYGTPIRERDPTSKCNLSGRQESDSELPSLFYLNGIGRGRRGFPYGD